MFFLSTILAGAEGSLILLGTPPHLGFCSISHSGVEQISQSRTDKLQGERNLYEAVLLEIEVFCVSSAKSNISAS